MDTFCSQRGGLSHSFLLEVSVTTIAQRQVEPVAKVEVLQILCRKAVRADSHIIQE